MPPLWSQRYAQRTQRMQGSPNRELFQGTDWASLISFAGECPAADTVPLAQVQDACQRVLAEHGAHALQYSPTEGYRPLRELIARHTARYGLTVTPDNILITTGSQQALDLLGKVLLNPGDRVLVEQPTHIGALQAWHAYQAEYVGIPVDDDGLQTDAVEAALRAGPKLLYTLPNFQNPTGVTLSATRRLQLVTLADRYGVPIVEDDPYGQLRYEGQHLPALAALDGHLRAQPGLAYTGHVLYVSTFSKVLAPGLRLGWIIAPEEVRQRLVQAKQGVDLHTSTLLQMVAYDVACGGFLDQHVRDVRVIYRERRDAMLTALDHAFPPEVHWTHPQGGLFIWATLPPHLDATDIFHAALAAHVAFVPGTAFFLGDEGRHTMRLSFSHATPEHIHEGIRRLGAILVRALQASHLL